MEIKKITEDEVRALWVQRLSDTPNRATRFGGEGMSAAEIKAVYDALPLCLVARYNALIDALYAGEFSGLLPLYGEKKLSDIGREITNGGLAENLTVYGTISLLELALEFNDHRHDDRYPRLNKSGRIMPEYLPIGWDSSFEEAEAKRVEAEKARVEAEAERGRRLDEITAEMAALDAREDAREMRESTREATLAAHGERLTLLEGAAAVSNARTAALDGRIGNLEAAAIGTTISFFEDSTAAYEKEIPEGVLSYASIDLIGGAADATKSTPVTAVSAYGANVLPYPYPAAKAGETADAGISFRQMEDGSILLNGTAERSVSFFLYNEQDGLSLPDAGVYIHSHIREGVTLYVKSGTSGTVWKTGRFQPHPSDEYYDRYVVYLYVERDTVLDNLRVQPCITRGLTPREAVAYRKPTRIEIPGEILALPGYGLYDNLLDLEAGLYRQRRSESGVTLSSEVTTPLPAPWGAPLYLPCEAGGYLQFENAEGAAVESTVTFAARIG